MFPETYDLAVIGGGLAGTAVARDAAGRGFSVFLAEALDLGEGASSATGGLACTSLDHLRTWALGRLQADVAELAVLMRSAPHLVQPTRLIVPRPKGLRAGWALRIGLAALNRMTDAPLQPSGRIRLAAGTSHGLLSHRVRIAYSVCDCVADDSRLVVLNAVDAYTRGASIRPRVRCIVAERNGERWRLSLEPGASGEPFVVEARALVNATGAAVANVNDHVIHTDRRIRVSLIRRAFIVVRRALPDGDAYAVPAEDGSFVYVTPLAGDLALVGPRSVPFAGDPATAAVERADVVWLLEAANRYLATPIGENDVVSGVAAAWAYPENAEAWQWATVVEAPPRLAPLVSVVGAGLISHRRAAEAAVSAVGVALRRDSPPWTATSALPGGAFPPGGVSEVVRALVAAYRFLTPEQALRFARAYGTRAQDILIGSRASVDLGRCFGADLSEGEVNYLRRREWAETASDILWRRSKLGFRLSAGEVEGLEQWMRRTRAAPPGPVLP